jgi:hypothetical protein
MPGASVPSLLNTPRPTSASPSQPHTFRFAEGDDPGAYYSVMVEVVDMSGLVKSARHAQPDPPEGEVRVDVPDSPVRMGFARLPTEPNSLLVMWLADQCSTRDRLTVSDDSRVIRLATSPKVTCGNGHVADHRIVLAFDRSVDISRIRAAAGGPLIGPDDVRPNAVSLESTGEVWVGGWSPLGESMLLHSTTAGDTWNLAGLGWGHVLDVAPLAGGQAIAVVDCGGIDWSCQNGLFGSGSLGGRIGNEPVVRVSLRTATDGILILAPYAGGDGCCYWLRPTTTSGLGLPEIANPCTAGSRPADVVKLGPSGIETICVSAGSNQDKQLLSSEDDGHTWTTLASSSHGDLPKAGSVKGFDMNADGFGLLWGAEAAPSMTFDGGHTWQPVAIADGVDRVARGGDVVDGETAAILVWDAHRSESIVMVTNDRAASWYELTSLAGG